MKNIIRNSLVLFNIFMVVPTNCFASIKNMISSIPKQTPAGVTFTLMLFFFALSIFAIIYKVGKTILDHPFGYEDDEEN